MAINVVFPLLIPLEEDLYNATRLLSGAGLGPLEFTEPRYCAVVREDARLDDTVTVVLAVHKRGEEVRYTITGGNKDGLFTIDQRTGVITLAATLDYEIHHKHELVVSAEGAGELVHTLVQVLVADVNDNTPYFLRPNPQVTVIEEDDRDLPLAITKVEAGDKDRVDEAGLLYSLRGDGVDGYGPNDAFFSVNSRTGELIQLRALDRDPPNGKGVWKVRVQVKDGQAPWKRLRKSGGQQNPSNSITRHTRQADQDSPTGGAALSVPGTPTPTGTPAPLEAPAPPGTPAPLEAPAPPGTPTPLGAPAPGTPTASETPARPGTPAPPHLPGTPTPLSAPGLPTKPGTPAPPGTPPAPGAPTPAAPRSPALPVLWYKYTDTLSQLRDKREASETREQKDPTMLYDVRGSTKQTSLRSGLHLNLKEKIFKTGRYTDQENEISRDEYHIPYHDYKPAISSVLAKEENVRTDQDDVLRANRPLGTEAMILFEESRKSEVMGPGSHREWSRRIKEHPEDGLNRVDTGYSRPYDGGERQTSRQTRNEFPLSSFCRAWLRVAATRAQRTRREARLKSFNEGRPSVGHLSMSGARVKYRGRPSTSFKFFLPGRTSAMVKRWSHGTLQPLFRQRKSKYFKQSLDVLRVEEISPLLPIVDTITQTDPLKCVNKYFSNFRNNSSGYSVASKTISGTKPFEELKESRNGNRKHNSGKQEASRIVVSQEDSTPVPSDNNNYWPYATNTQESLKNLHEVITKKTTSLKTSKDYPGTISFSFPFWPAEDISRDQNMITSSGRLRRKSSSSKGNLASDTFHGARSTTRRKRTAESIFFLNDEFDRAYGVDEDDGFCESLDLYGGHLETRNGTAAGGRPPRVHTMETVVTVVVKDINDNAPTFPNTTMFGEVQENGPIDLSVAVVSAWDADDATEGTNARLTYSIEKNVIDERSGEAIFAVHPETGLVRTALCCLDRETTPEYNIQVVASDGGGLKGTGTVVIRLADVNDNSPRLARQQWDLKVDETWGNRPPNNATILEITAADRDTANYFHYRVVESSGWGWQHFGIRTMGAVGQLYARKTLDYEDEMHRRGFRFMVQVTDRGRGGWKDPRHLDSAWVTVKLRDLNDNAPHFSRPHAHITVREDTAPGTLLASLHAHDPDMAGQQKVDYQVSGGWGALTVGADGGVSLWRSLDREAPDGDTGVATVIAVDRGRPPLTSTATLTITVADVNDCAPRLLPPTVLHVTEGTPPTLLGVLTATDYDVWALGHGPPFNFTLSPTNPIHVLTHIKLKFDPHLDSGRGGAELWTSRPADREEHRSLEVQVTIGDAGGVTATHPVTVVIDDLNDNPMKPASKTVYLWKTQGGGGSKAPLGRVYVEDPDDWDLEDKTFQWVGPPHPLFSLNPNDGTIFASSQVREGRYELHFSVSDRAWRQRGVSANVTVAVRLLSQEALAHAAPITLTPTTPTDLTRGWTPTHGGGGLGRLVEGILKAVGEGTHTAEVVSVYGHPHYAPPHYHHHHYYHHHHHHPSPHAAHSPPTALEDGTEARQHPPRVADTLPPSACVWVSVRDQRGVFMDPIKLHGLLGLHSRQLEEATSLKVWLESSGITGRRRPEEFQSPDLHRDLQRLLHDLKQGEDGDPSSAASLASTALPLQVVDTNATSLVTPRLSRAHACYAHEPESCTPTSCLNGGSCIRLATGNRCVCPGGSKGWQCKVLSRTFSGSGWAWVRPLPPCLPTTISLRVLTWQPNALILYSGPLSPQQRPPESSSSSSSTPPPTPMLALQLKYGRPQLLLEGGIVPLKLEVNTTIHGGDWHTLHVHLDTQGVALMVDLCGQGWENNAQNDVHCLAQADWSAPFGLEEWLGSGPLQVGGIAHSPPTAHDHGWGEAPTARPLEGCVSHLILNGQLVDLGEPAYSQGNTAAGCKPQESACPAGCGVHGECAGGLKHPGCECQPGWGESGCSTPTVPASLGKSSYVKVALSFTPAPRVLKVQLRVRTRGARHGLLLHLAAHHHSAAFMLHLRSSVVCASLTGSEWAAMAACVEARPLGDGEWHTVQAERHGDNLLVSVDDGDGWRRNESLASFLVARDGGRRREPPSALNVDKHDGVTVGGLPEFVGVKLVGIRDDLVDACVDDLRVSNHPLPLPPAINGTSWGQVTTLQHLERGCEAPDACLNTTCAQPLTCTTTWGQATCSCGPGRQLVDRTCEDIDECVWRPCLHGGSCYNLRPGFLCVCGPGHMGDHCQWTTLASSTNSLTAPVAIAALTASLIVLLVVGLVVSLRLHRHRTSLGLRERGADVDDTAKGTVVEVKRRSRRGKGADEDEGGGGGGGGLEGEKELREDDTHETFLECLKFKLPSSQPALKKKGKRSSCRSEASPTESADAVVSSGDPSAGAAGAAGADGETAPPDPLLPRDDLRAYAYEGDGSSSGSFASTISDLKVEMAEEDSTIVPLVPEFLEVMDLLKNLPEAPKKASFTRKRSASLKTSSSPKEPTPSCIVLGKNSGSCPGDAATSNLESSAPSIILVKGSGSPGCPRDPVTSSLVLGKGGSGSPRFPRDSPVSSIVLVKGSGAAIKPSIRTRLSHLSPSRFKGEGTSKTDVVLAKGESEVSTVC